MARQQHHLSPPTFWENQWSDETKPNVLAKTSGAKTHDEAFWDKNHCYSSAETGAEVKIEGIMDKAKYQTILPQILPASISKWMMNMNLIFQLHNTYLVHCFRGRMAE